MINRIRPDRSSDPGHGDTEMRDLQTEEGMGVNNSNIPPGSPGQTSSVTLPTSQLWWCIRTILILMEVDVIEQLIWEREICLARRDPS